MACEPKCLLGFQFLKKDIRLRMGLPRDRIESVNRFSDQIPHIAPSSIDGSIVGRNALVFPQSVANRDLPIEVGGRERKRVRERDVRGRKAERRSGYADGTVSRESVAAVVRIGHI